MRRARHVALPGEIRVHTGFSLVHLKERDHLEELRVDGRAWIGLISITLGTSCCFFPLPNATTCPFVDFVVPLSWAWQECNRLLRLGALVNTVMNLPVPINAGVTGLDEDLCASQEGLCPVELVR